MNLLPFDVQLIVYRYIHDYRWTAVGRDLKGLRNYDRYMIDETLIEYMHLGGYLICDREYHEGIWMTRHRRTGTTIRHHTIEASGRLGPIKLTMIELPKNY